MGGQQSHHAHPGKQPPNPPPQAPGPAPPYPPAASPSTTQGPQRTLGQSPTIVLRDKYGVIPDDFTSLAQVQAKLREVGLESSNLIVGIDFTKSNEWTGKNSFRGRSLHAISGGGSSNSNVEQNPYEQAISIIGQTLAPFDEDGLIPCYGFGDVSTHDKRVFSFYPEDRPCRGFAEVLQRYRQILPHVKLAGPTSFAPIIEAAVRTVELSGGQYHVLVIIADGQVTRSVDLPPNELSDQERATVDAICAASNYPLSIILVGVGDGPWDTMHQFDDAIPQRNFDNFQFVNLTQIMSKRSSSPQQLEAKFALMALMEVPAQFRACTEMRLVGRPVGRMPPNAPLPPPEEVLAADRQTSGAAPVAPLPSTPAADTSAAECPVCWQNPKGMAFQCGHQTCEVCGNQLRECPICRRPVTLRIKLF